MINSLLLMLSLITPDESVNYYTVDSVHVTDGDTVRADIHLGLSVELTGQSLRLYGINAPETRGSSKGQGLISKAFLTSLLSGRPTIIQTIKDKRDKYGRLLVIIWIQSDQPWCSTSWCSVNEYMVLSGHAESKEYE